MFHVFLAPVRLVAVNDSGHLLNQRRGFPDALTRFMKCLRFQWEIVGGARDRHGEPFRKTNGSCAPIKITVNQPVILRCDKGLFG